MNTKIIQKIFISILIIMSGYACLFSPAVQGEINPAKENSITSLIMGLIGLTRSSNTTSSGNANTNATGTGSGTSADNGTTTTTGTSAGNGSTTTGTGTATVSAPSNLVYTGSPFTFTNGATIATQTPTVTGTITNCAVTPSLPTGLILNATTCAISGTPTVNQAATSYTITASNSSGNTTASVSITVNMAAPSNLVYSGSPFTFTNGSAIVTQTPTVTGTVTGCVATPSLPTGLILNATTCAISGTPTVNQGANSYTITASNAGGNTTASVSITVNIPITSPSSLSYSGSPYSFTSGISIITITPSISGGAATSCISSPALPTGLNLNNTSCAISGTPGIEASKITYTITASNSGGSTNATLVIDVKLCYAWGCFQDMGNGTVQFVGNAGTFGGNTYSAQTLYFKKCRQGQMWNSTKNDCTGWGDPPQYLAGTYKFCSATNNNCNGGVASNELGIGGFLSGSTSSAYNTCNNVGTFAGRTGWRVPTKLELKTLINCTNKIMPNDGDSCGSGNYDSLSVSNLFPNYQYGRDWTSTTLSLDTSAAWTVQFGDGFVFADEKTIDDSVRCVSGP